jgi:hypothetical protein
MRSHSSLADDFPIASRFRGSPRFLIALSMPAVPSHPEEPDRCLYLLLHGRRLASPPLTGWPLPLLNGAETGSHYITADIFAFRGFDRWITPTAARLATG